MTLADERFAMAQVIANSFYAMQAGELPDPATQPEPSAGDLQLASDLQEAGYRNIEQSADRLEPVARAIFNSRWPGYEYHHNQWGGNWARTAAEAALKALDGIA